jgi:hypothetical protein
MPVSTCTAGGRPDENVLYSDAMTDTTVKVIAGVLLVIVIVIIFVRRKSKKKTEEDDF